MFKPDIKQLEALAKVANVDVEYRERTGMVHILGDSRTAFWRPHINRDQIALIVDRITLEQVENYDDKMENVWLGTMISHQFDTSFGSWMQTVDPSISCQKLCEVIK